MYGERFKMRKATIWSHGFRNEKINDLQKMSQICAFINMDKNHNTGEFDDMMSDYI